MRTPPDPITRYILTHDKRFMTPEENRLSLSLGLFVADEQGTPSPRARQCLACGYDRH